MLATYDRQPSFYIHQNIIRRLILSSSYQEATRRCFLFYSIHSRIHEYEHKNHFDTVLMVLLSFYFTLSFPFPLPLIKVTIIARNCSSYPILLNPSYGVSQSKNFYDTNLVFLSPLVYRFPLPLSLVVMYVYVSSVCLAVGSKSVLLARSVPNS